MYNTENEMYKESIRMEIEEMSKVYARHDEDLKKVKIYYSFFWSFYFMLCVILVIYTKLLAIVLAPILFWLLYKFTMKYAPRVKNHYTPYGDYD